MHTVVRRSSHLSLLALLLLGSSGCARRAYNTTPTLPTSVTRDVDAVAYSASGGVVFPVRIELRPTTTGEPRIAVFEEYAGGAGDMWRASTWIAAVHASRTLQRNLGEHEISVSVGGLIDGPSAGALMTSGIMAAMQNVPVRTDVTMTGTINPDGTVGPVGGIAHKMRAAAEAGKRHFGYPRGSRFDADPQTGEAVDLWSLAAQLGIQVYELEDVEDAYLLLTGHQLPQVEPVPASFMVPSPASDSQMRAGIRAYVAEVRAGLAVYERQDETTKELLAETAQRAVTYVGDSDRYLRQGLVSMAYKSARDAAVFASGIPNQVRLMSAVTAMDIERLANEMQAMFGVEHDLERYVARVQVAQPYTVDDAMVLLDAYDWGLQARSAITKAQLDRATGLEILQSDEDLTVERVAQAMMCFASAALQLSATERLLALGQMGMETAVRNPHAPPIDHVRLVDLARSTTSAARAIVDYHDAIFVQQAADQHGISADRARGHLLLNDWDYRNARLQVNVAYDHRNPTNVHEALLALAAARRAFIDGSLLVMRDYSLGVREQDGRRVVSNDLALMTSLELADRRAREAAASAMARFAAVPDTASIMYERSRMMGQGSVDDRLNSLRGYWQVAGYCQTALHIAALPIR